MTLIEKAFEFAVRAHLGQIDEDGFPHVLHCMEVASAAKQHIEKHGNRTGYPIEVLIAAAILHDTVEDSSAKGFTLESLEEEFGKDVRDIVDGLTRRGLGVFETKEFYRDFIYRAATNPGSKLIKVCDLHHNYERIHKISPKKAAWGAKLTFKYGTAIKVLEQDETWEQASWFVTYDMDALNTPHYFIADPNGKKIEVDEAEFHRKPIKVNKL